MSRPPYDDVDLQKVLLYLSEKGRLHVDPLGKDAAPSDPYFAPSLLSARRLMEFAFANKRADGSEFRAYPAFVERSPPNAFAVDLGGVHLCGVDAGLVTTSFELCCFSLSQREFLPEIGDASKEESPKLPEGAMLGYWIMDHIAQSHPAKVTGFGEELIPLDTERRLTAHFLSQLMLRFAWLHELYHGLNGHSGYLASLRKGYELQEMPDEEELALGRRVSIVSIPERTLHCMEFDADRSASYAMMQIQLASEEPFAVLAEQPLTARLKLTVLAALLTVFLFDQAARRSPPKEPATHPAARLRLYNLIGTTATNAGSEPVEVREALANALVGIEQLRASIPALIDPVLLKRELSSPALRRVLSRADADLEVLRREWSPFAYRRPT
jgi:hypothetical protein